MRDIRESKKLTEVRDTIFDFMRKKLKREEVEGRMDYHEHWSYPGI